MTMIIADFAGTVDVVACSSWCRETNDEGDRGRQAGRRIQTYRVRVKRQLTTGRRHTLCAAMTWSSCWCLCGRRPPHTDPQWVTWQTTWTALLLSTHFPDSLLVVSFGAGLVLDGRWFCQSGRAFKTKHPTGGFRGAFLLYGVCVLLNPRPKPVL